MADLENLIEDIRMTLAYSNAASPEKLPGYAEQYAEECTKLNERLKQCLPHLRAGNIAEAVRLADSVSPTVTETFNLLDFEDRQDWIDVCESLGFAVAPPLSTGIFQELNDAYLQMASLEPLLKWHRLYARNGSPLRDRLAVLRSIAKADPMNLYWQTDQETYEKARMKELEQEISDAFAKKNMMQVMELYRELTSPDWRIPPSAEHREKICTVVLGHHVDELRRCFSVFDHDNATLAYQSIRQVLAANQMTMPTSIEHAIRGAVQWMQDTANEKIYKHRFHHALEELQEALNTNASIQDLENLYFALKKEAEQGNLVISEEMELHYRRRIEGLARKEKFRTGMTITAIVGALLLISIFVFFAFTR